MLVMFSKNYCAGDFKIHKALKGEADDSHSELQLLKGGTVSSEVVGSEVSEVKYNRAHQHSRLIWLVSIGSVWLRGRLMTFCEAVSVLHTL